MPNMSKYLEHYGVPGMRWGKRKAGNNTSIVTLGPGEYRFKNEGSSSNRQSSNGSSNRQSSNGSSNRQSNKSGNKQTNNNTQSNTNNKTNSKLDIKSTQKSLSESKKLADAGAKYLDNERKKQTIKDLKKEAKSMTDDELRTVINRLNMEERYVSAMEKEGVGKSKTDLQKTLEIVGTAVSYADTALSVYDKIQEFRSR